MSNLRFYEEEKARWPQLHWNKGPRMGRTEVELGIRRLASKFGLSLKGVVISFTSGCRISCADYSSITINLDYVDWLVIAHELGHVYWFRKYKARRQRNAHGRQLARIIDRFCEWIVQQGWNLGNLAHEVALMEIEQEAKKRERKRLAAQPAPIEARIGCRARQAKRLETKIKALTMRLRRANRSLAALRRSQIKMGRTFGIMDKVNQGALSGANEVNA